MIVGRRISSIWGNKRFSKFWIWGTTPADRVMRLLLGQWAAIGPAAVLVFLGALAAIMSTADSCVPSLGSSLAEEVLGRSR
jgi:Na+/proline symporter